MSNQIRTPDQVSAATLRKLARRYANPKNSMDAFILHGIKAAMRDRDIDHPTIPTNFGDNDESDGGYGYGATHDAAIEQFEADVHDVQPAC